MTDIGHTHTYEPPQIEARELIDQPLIGTGSASVGASASFTHL
jgi:hypothetical protein